MVTKKRIIALLIILAIFFAGSVSADAVFEGIQAGPNTFHTMTSGNGGMGGQSYLNAMNDGSSGYYVSRSEPQNFSGNPGTWQIVGQPSGIQSMTPTPGPEGQPNPGQTVSPAPDSMARITQQPDMPAGSPTPTQGGNQPGTPTYSPEPIEPATPEPQTTKQPGTPTPQPSGVQPQSPTMMPEPRTSAPTQLPMISSPPTSRPYQRYQDDSYNHPYGPDTGALQVISSPTGASVYLNNNYKGKTPSSGYLEISYLTPGTYSILLSYSGYGDYSTEVTVYRNEVTTISADMIPETTVVYTSYYGILSIQSEPSGAELLIDNEYKGITPLTLKDITTGEHTILVRKDGYSEYYGQIYITPDETLAVSAILTLLPTQTQTQLPSQIPVPVTTEAVFPFWIVGAGLAGGALLFMRKN